MKIIWNGPLLDPSGYGNCARTYVKALHDKGHYVRVQPVQYFMGEPRRHMSEETYNLLIKLLMKPNVLNSDFIHVEHKTPGVFTSGNYKKNIGYSVWETDRIPEVFVHNICMKDELWTASKYSKGAFMNSGVDIPIKIIPHIVDTEKFCSDGKEIKTLMMLFNGEFTYRKGVDVLIKAYLKAFNNTDKVMLLLKTYVLNNKSTGYQYMNNMIKTWIAECNPSSPPKIKILNKVLSDEDLPKLYELSNVFVTATRGEGFGIPIAEAMSSQNLIIAPDKGGHMDFCDTSNSILIDSDIKPINKDLLEDDRKVYTDQKWINPDENHLIEIFRDVYKNYNKYEDLRIRGRRTIEKHCNADRIVDMIGESI